MIEARNPQVGKSVVKFRELSADERVRDTHFRREMMRRDISAQTKKARREGRQEGMLDVAAKMLKRNRPIDEIIEDTGLTRDEVEGLRQ